MFKNIPEWLAEKVSAIQLSAEAKDRQTIYYAAAGWTISYYLRKDISLPNVDSFLEPRADEFVEHKHANRAIAIADLLFQLRVSPGFEELRKRLETRELRPSYFELMAAKQFLKAGFDIHAFRSTGVRGRDFDFQAKRNNEIVNIEVTALEAAEFSDRTVLNALNQKRKQLPSDAPSVVYCTLPERWLERRTDWDFALKQISDQFFRSTRRVNGIVFWVEQHFLFGNGEPGGALALIRKPYFNPNPRHATDLTFLVGGTHVEKLRLAMATGVGLEALEKVGNESEFFRWVDHLVPESSGP